MTSSSVGTQRDSTKTDNKDSFLSTYETPNSSRSIQQLTAGVAQIITARQQRGRYSYGAGTTIRTSRDEAVPTSYTGTGSSPTSIHRETAVLDTSDNMANPLDTDAGSELFTSYEAELKLVQADLTQKLEQIPELAGEPRKAAISQAERALEEANELVTTSPRTLQ